MIDNNKEMRVTNRSAQKVIYFIPSEGIRRDFAPGETRKITYGELTKLSFEPGGRTLMADYLLITDPDAPDYKNPTAEPEYYYGEKEVEELLKNGSIDEFLDALDFAPDGVKDLIKDLAVKLPLNDIAKRNALKEKLHFDLDAVIANSGTEDGVSLEKPAERRVKTAANNNSSKNKRRTNK